MQDLGNGEGGKGREGEGLNKKFLANLQTCNHALHATILFM